MAEEWKPGEITEYDWRPGDSIDRTIRYAAEKGDAATVYRYIQRDIFNYINSSDYRGPPINWVETPYGRWPEGGIESIEKPINPSNNWDELENSLGRINHPMGREYGYWKDTINFPEGTPLFTNEWINANNPETKDIYGPLVPPGMDIPPAITAGQPAAPGQQPGQAPGQPAPQAPPENFYAPAGAGRTPLDFSGASGNPFAQRAGELGFTDYQSALRQSPPIPPKTSVGTPTSISSGATPGYGGGGGGGTTPTPGSTPIPPKTSVGTPTSISSGTAPGYGGGGGGGTGPVPGSTMGEALRAASGGVTPPGRGPQPEDVMGPQPAADYVDPNPPVKLPGQNIFGTGTPARLTSKSAQAARSAALRGA